MRLFRAAAFLLLVSFSRAAVADPVPLTPIPVGDDKIATMKLGAPAPFEGQLFDTPTALRWANYLYQCKFRLNADVVYQKKLDDADKNALQSELTLERNQYQLVTVDLQQRLQEVQGQVDHPPFYKDVWFGVAIGVVGSIGLMVAGAAMLGVVKK